MIQLVFKIILYIKKAKFEIHNQSIDFWALFFFFFRNDLVKKFFNFHIE